jgi:hypothetical protein
VMLAVLVSLLIHKVVVRIIINFCCRCRYTGRTGGELATWVTDHGLFVAVVLSSR